ncbi:hypothetical protein ACOZ38_22195 [Sphaerisporangium viridialbum]
MGRRGSSEHREFAEAVERRDAGAASEIMRAHPRRTADRVSHTP